MMPPYLEAKNDYRSLMLFNSLELSDFSQEISGKFKQKQGQYNDFPDFCSSRNISEGITKVIKLYWLKTYFPWSNSGKLFFHSIYIYIDGESKEKPLPTFFSW